MTCTLGIDLSSQPTSTALCLVRWGAAGAEVAELRLGADDEAIVGTIAREAPAKVGIDAPLGWPADFVAAVGDLDRWPVALGGSRARLERRETDRWVHEQTGKLPLSVTTDRIAYPAMRAVGLLAHLAAGGARIDRSGVTGLVCETYPDPTIRRLGLWPEGRAARESYKRAATDVRAAILDVLAERAPWLGLSAEQRERCIAVDDCLDALVCALAARAAAKGLTAPPPAEHADVARSEGWIHLPNPDVLDRLVI